MDRDLLSLDKDPASSPEIQLALEKQTVLLADLDSPFGTSQRIIHTINLNMFETDCRVKKKACTRVSKQVPGNRHPGSLGVSKSQWSIDQRCRSEVESTSFVPDLGLLKTLWHVYLRRA